MDQGSERRVRRDSPFHHYHHHHHHLQCRSYTELLTPTGLLPIEEVERLGYEEMGLHLDARESLSPVS